MYSKYTRVDNGVESMYAYNGLREWVQCMLLMGNGNSSMQTKLNKSHSLALCSLCSLCSYVLMSKTLIFMSKREMKVCKLHCSLACARTI